MAYRVKARDRGGWPGRYRSGRFFPKTDWTVLPDDELTEAIRTDPELIVEQVPDSAEAAAGEGAEPGESPAPRRRPRKHE